MDFDLKEQFQELFGAAPAFTAFAPGRVNLIGEHIDYNGGHVLPCALSLGIGGAIRLRDDGLMRFASAQFPESGITEHPLDDLLEEIAQNASVKKRDWTMYVRGVLWSYAQRGYSVDRGFDLLVGGDLPGNAGLSSSAALEVLTARLFAAAYGIGDLQDPTFLPLLAQNAENGYVGMHCGIMDQYASANGKKDHALFLDCNQLTCDYTPLVLAGYKLVISNTNKPHSLAGSAYNDRRAECAEALDDLRTLMPELPSLCALTPVQFETMSAVIKNEKARRRAEHAVYEEDRAVSACEALRKGDLAEFGKLMYGSHLSLKDLFEVSCMELDTLVDLAMRHPGVLGSRMTGGGFGGCTITLIRENETTSFIEKTGAAYKEKAGLTASFYVAEPGDGVHLLA